MLQSFSYTTNTSSLLNNSQLLFFTKIQTICPFFHKCQILLLSLLCLKYSSSVFHHLIFRIQLLKNSKYDVNNSWPKIPIMSQTDPVKTVTFCFSKMHLSFLHPSKCTSATRLFPEGFQLRLYMHPYSLPCVPHALPISSSLI